MIKGWKFVGRLLLLLLIVVGTNLFTLRYGEGIKRRVGRVLACVDGCLIQTAEPLSDDVGAWYASEKPIVFAHAGGGMIKASILMQKSVLCA